MVNIVLQDLRMADYANPSPRPNQMGDAEAHRTFDRQAGDPVSFINIRGNLE